MTELTKPFLELADEAFRVEPSFKKDFNNHYVRDLAQTIRTLVAMLEKCREQRDIDGKPDKEWWRELTAEMDQELKAIAESGK